MCIYIHVVVHAHIYIHILHMQVENVDGFLGHQFVQRRMQKPSSCFACEEIIWQDGIVCQSKHLFRHTHMQSFCINVAEVWLLSDCMQLYIVYTLSTNLTLCAVTAYIHVHVYTLYMLHTYMHIYIHVDVYVQIGGFA